MTDMEKVIKELHDARRYLEDKEWSDRGASPHIDAINDALILLKGKDMKAEKVKYEVNKWTKLPVSYCPYCGKHVDMYLYGRPDELVKYCPFCGQALDWDENV